MMPNTIEPEHHHRAEVRLQHHQQHRHRGDRDRLGDVDRPGVLPVVRLALLGDQQRHSDDHRELGELARLDRHPGQLDPRARSVDHRTDAGHQHEDQPDHRSGVQHRGEDADPAVVGDGRADREDQADREVERVPDQELVLVAVGERLRCDVADQISRLPIAASASTPITSTQSACHSADRRSTRGRDPGSHRQETHCLRLLRGGRRGRLDVVERLVDVPHRRSRGARTATGLADHHHHGVAIGVRREPRRRLLAVDLGRTRLRAHRHLVQREPGELPRRRTGPGGLHQRPCRCTCSVDAGHRQPAGHLRRDRLGLAVRRDHLLGHPRLPQRAAVRERGVDRCQLQRSQRGVALTDREVHRVACAVAVSVGAELPRELLQERRRPGGRVVGQLAVVVLLGVVVLLLPLPVRDPAGRLAGQVDPGCLAEPEALGHLDQRVADVDVAGVAALAQPQGVGDLVEEGVAGHAPAPAGSRSSRTGRSRSS